MVNNIPVKKRRTYTIAQKRRIVAEAYSEPRRIKTVARKYRVQGNQVRSWRVLLELPNRQEGDKRVYTTKSIRLCGGGRKKVWPPEFIAKIKEYVDGRREMNYAVSMRRTVAEARMVDLVRCFDLSTIKSAAVSAGCSSNGVLLGGVVLIRHRTLGIRNLSSKIL
jgi:hypothetical protein